MSFGSQAWTAARQRRLEARLKLGASLKRIVVAALLLLLGLWCCRLSLDSYGLRSWLLWPGGLCMLALGLGVGATTSFLLWTKRPALVIDAQGLDHALLGAVRWADVAGLALEHRSNQPMLAIGLQAGAPIEGGWSWLRALQGEGPLRLPLAGLDQDPGPVLQAAEAARDQVGPPRVKAWHPGMSARLAAALLENDRLLAEAEEIVRRPQLGPADEAEALANAERMSANTREMLAAMDSDTKALVRKGNRLATASIAVAVAYVLLMLARLVLQFG